MQGHGVGSGPPPPGSLACSNCVPGVDGRSGADCWEKVLPMPTVVKTRTRASKDRIAVCLVKVVSPGRWLRWEKSSGCCAQLAELKIDVAYEKFYAVHNPGKLVLKWAKKRILGPDKACKFLCDKVLLISNAPDYLLGVLRTTKIRRRTLVFQKWLPECRHRSLDVAYSQSSPSGAGLR